MSAAACSLYLITPPTIPDLDAFASSLEEAFRGGDVAALQIRLKEATDAQIEAAVRKLKPLCQARGATLILNDRPDLAAAFDCDGVHIGQDDMPLDEARRFMGRERTIGVTCQDSRHVAMEAAEGGADYVAFGAFFPTSTKITTVRADLEILEIWQEAMLIPCVAIGGIMPENCQPLVTAGADFLAVCGGVWDRPEGPATAVSAFHAAITRGMAGRALALS